LIKFRCTNCGQKFKIPDSHAGRKGKCPKCKNQLAVPDINTIGLVYEQETSVINNQQNSSSHTSELQLKKEPLKQTEKSNRISENIFDTINSQQYITNTETAEKPPVRKLPWIIDIFLYPTSIPGLINLGVFWILPILLGFIRLILPIPFVWWIVGLVIAAYMYYYFIECIRDSAMGGIRAPENIAAFPEMSDVLSQLLEIVASIAIFWGPIVVYTIYKVFWQSTGANPINELRSDVIFWSLLGYSIFFFPMGILALAMFQSTSAFNPFLWIVSILSTFFHYCCLVVFLCFLAWLFSRIVSFFQESLLFAFLLNGIFIYLIMINTHLLGCFYYLNSKKLNWEV
jgi:hypothetical protein